MFRLNEGKTTGAPWVPQRIDRNTKKGTWTSLELSQALGGLQQGTRVTGELCIIRHHPDHMLSEQLRETHHRNGIAHPDLGHALVQQCRMMMVERKVLMARMIGLLMTIIGVVEGEKIVDVQRVIFEV